MKSDMSKYTLSKKQHEYVHSMVSPRLAEKICKIGLRLISAEQVDVRTETKLMFWPFAYSKSKLVKTCFAKVTKEFLFQAMRELPSVPFEKKSARAYKGTAHCRVCGASVGSSDELSASGTIRPSGVDHYKREHGINLNLVSRTVTDPDTKIMWHVVYIGALSELGTK